MALPKSLNGLENLRGSALGFRHFAHYIARSRLKTGGFRPRLCDPAYTPDCEEPGMLSRLGYSSRLLSSRAIDGYTPRHT